MLEPTSAAPPDGWLSTAGAGADTPLGRGPFAVAAAIFRVCAGELERRAQQAEEPIGWRLVFCGRSLFCFLAPDLLQLAGVLTVQWHQQRQEVVEGSTPPITVVRIAHSKGGRPPFLRS